MKSSTLFIRIIPIVFLLNIFIAPTFAANPHEILSAQMIIDGEPDDNLEQKATVFELTTGRIGGGIGPYVTYLCYDAQNVYFACSAEDDFVSCLDDVTCDLMDSDYIRFYICLDDTFKGRQALSSKNDWALIFAPQDTDGNWKPMVVECPYNGPGHGSIRDDDITTKRASSETADGWYLEAAIPFTLFNTKLEELEGEIFGVYFIAGDTDKAGTRTGEMSLEGPGAGNYWESPDYWQESKLGEFMSVDKIGKTSSLWGQIKNEY